MRLLITAQPEAACPDAPAIDVTYDPRMRLHGRIDEILQGSFPYSLNTCVAFNVHSLARLFGRYDLANERYVLTLRRANGGFGLVAIEHPPVVLQ